ncbi:YceI family protein [Draconibacterium sp. IB214405]|uniref:YceI family protein n=1 Tax=Draconibacterium sp. IB214405 TaxID=3097352 RepID=UPI002A0FC948|nr:YceI family protein [Draconibacterium sp. IB214405]MDX8337922.1 YceI family protein [Draconibacterium sp. IB214405]
MATEKTIWVLDPTHSEITFKVKHLMISNVKGEFKNFNVTVEGEDFESSKIQVNVDTGSVYTNNTDRDNHLKSVDFFDVENYNEMTFESTSFKKVDDDEYKLTGLLTIKGVSKEMTLDVEFGGTNKDPWGNEKAGFSLEGKINRKEWGLSWNAALESGGVLVSEDVKLQAEVQLVKQTA